MTNNQNKNAGTQLLESLVAFRNTVIETFNSFSPPVQEGILMALAVFGLSTIINLIFLGSAGFLVTLIVSVIVGLARYHVGDIEYRLSILEKLNSDDDINSSDGTNG